MTAVISAEHPASPDATALISELDAHLEPLYPSASRHGFSVQKLIADSVAFFVIRDAGAAAGCGGIKLFGAEYGEIKRMYVRPQFRRRGLGKLMLDHLTEYAKANGVGILRLETRRSSERRHRSVRARMFQAYPALRAVQRRPGQPML